MTVSYQYEVASSTSGGFTRLLFMWRGSLYKLIYRELVLFLVLFGLVSALYRHILTESQKKDFETIVIYCDTFIKLIPLSFVLGFYVSYVARRWWDQYTAVPWPDKVMHAVALYVTGNDEYARVLRRSLMRYLNLSLILVLRSISSAVKRRFPTLDHVVDSGFMTSIELELFNSVPSLEFNTYWIPCTWFINLLKEARKTHRLSDPQGLKFIMEEFNDYRGKCGMLWSYDWVSIPLVYTQVVTIATYSFFAVAIIGRQYIEGNEKQFQLKIDIYLPVFTILQFFFFMGLLKVAEQLINPFGDDDEDFELNWLIDRHTKVSYLGVDTLMNRCPPMVKDIYFDSENLILPYTEAAAAYKRKTYRGSVANMTVPEEKQTMFLPDITEDGEEDSKATTPRTSSANITTTQLNDNQMNNRRQNSESPSTTPKMARKSSATVLHLDVEDSGRQQTGQKYRLADTVKKISSMGRAVPCDQNNRKPFFPQPKAATKLKVQPWPSATNLLNPVQHTLATFSKFGHRFSNESRTDSEQSSGKRDVLRSESIHMTTVEPKRESFCFVNNGFSQNSLLTSRSPCDCISKLNSDFTCEICQVRCIHSDAAYQYPEYCNHSETDRGDLSNQQVAYTRPMFILGKPIARRRSKNVDHQLPSVESSSILTLRRRTTDTLPPVEKTLPQTWSSPNLKSFNDDQVKPSAKIHHLRRSNIENKFEENTAL
ncbi:bestrophin-4-like isoform X2 [Prorops nasuta]|uniref:bestrophin-4-like isoform X2 n=1 Tax=Prorops nasuta TaxID=863751 RepID=UPI0034CD5D3B